MKQGDIVRFAKPGEIDTLNSKGWPKIAKRHIGILLEHNKLMGTAQVLYEGEVYKLRCVFVEKAGRKDFDKNKL